MINRTEFTRENIASRFHVATAGQILVDGAQLGALAPEIIETLLDELALILSDQALHALRGPYSRDTAMSWLNAADALTVPETVPLVPAAAEQADEVAS